MRPWIQLSRLPSSPRARGQVELVFDEEHLSQVVCDGLLRAKVSLEVATADFKAMLIPNPGGHGATSIVQKLRLLADKGVEVRLLHAGTPSAAALLELKREIPGNLVIRRCPRLHAKAIIIDSQAMYMGSANLTGAGLGAKGIGRRNFEWGIWTRSSELIEAVSEQFNALWEGQRCKSCRRKDICPVPLEEPALG